MNIHKRFIVQFFVQLIIIFVLFSLILLSFWVIIGFTQMREEVTRDLSKADNFFISNRITIHDGEVEFDEDLKKLTNEQGGWFVLISDDGEVLGSYNTPPQALERFKSNLSTLILENNSVPRYTYWKLDESDPNSNVVIFSKGNNRAMMLDEVKADINWENHNLNLSDTTVQRIEAEKGWVQLINSEGNVVDEFGVENEPINYSIQDLLTLKEDASSPVATYFDTGTEQTILVGKDNSEPTTSVEESVFNTVSNGFLIIFIVLFLLLVIGTFWYARKFGVPLITMMKWIQNLGSGSYEQPLDIHQQPVMLNKKGKLKRKYRLYKDLIKNLSQLTDTLKENELQRKKMTQTREEWISGISHDLKTPLASISGYAQMLESENYSWTEKETREFAGIIAGKSTYMKELLEDLTLTYRLKNQALPIVKEQVDINEFLRQTIIHFINDPANNDKEINFDPFNNELFASIDPKWFQRIIDNLIANALKYNPAGTTVTVSTSPIEQHLTIITIEDDGIGMDKETLSKLFQRYYRGTNTSDSGSGTGLGMAITKQLVRLHGGSINVKSKPKQGTTVRIILPI